MSEPTADQVSWFKEELASWTTEIEVLTPSQWAERNRYLPQSTTNLPGYYKFDVTPYLREIVDCFSIDSPVREVAVMKGVQIGYTVGVPENVIGYCIDHVKTSPTMFVTADAELANHRLNANILPMIQNSNLGHLIKSSDESSKRKSGSTQKRIEWAGGGWLVPFGAQNANKLRSLSIRFLLEDENDAWPLKVGRDGDPEELVRARTSAFEDSRKIGKGSTPLIEGQSKIHTSYLRGDQRKYFVCCLECAHPQELRWRRQNPDTGEVTGISWELDEGGRLIPGSVRYLCEECGHAHRNDDKTKLLSPEHGAEWRPTAVPANPNIRSYHISALYSPVGMASWDACVEQWLKAWDVENNKPRDLEQLQVFYNNVLGMPYKLQGEKLRFEQVSPHRRQWFNLGTIPNKAAKIHAGGPIVALICTVDIQKDWMAVGVFGFSRGRRPFVVERFNLGNDPYNPHQNTGDTEHLDDPHTWGKLRELIESRSYVADDGAKYKISLTLVDSGYRKDQVYDFVAEYNSGVVAVKGRETPNDNTTFRHFYPIKAPMGILVYGISVDVYKDRLAAALKHDWDGFGLMPEGQFSAGGDLSDRYLKELTVETKRERVDVTGKRIGWEWHRPNGARNETLDLSVYALAGLDLLAFHTFPPDEKAGVYLVNWAQFFASAEGTDGGAPLFFIPPN